METAENRLKRLDMRSRRRGIKEMDIILARFSERLLAGLSADDLDLYESLLSENDHDILQWVTGQTASPNSYVALTRLITSHTGVEAK